MSPPKPPSDRYTAGSSILHGLYATTVSLVPFLGRNVPDDLAQLRQQYDGLLAADSERLQRMDLHSKENSLSRTLPGSADHLRDDDYGRKNRTSPTDEIPRHNLLLPLGKAVTVKHAYRIAGQTPECHVDERAETPEERYRSDTMEKIVWASYRASRGETTFSSAAWDASELGAAVFDLYFDDAQGLPVFRRCDPKGVVLVQGIDDPHDFERVYRSWDAPLQTVAAQYGDKVFRDQPVQVEALAKHHTLGKTDYVRIVQMCDKGRVVRFACGIGGGETVGLYEFDHSYGFCPYIVIPNIGPYEDVWGWSDYEFVRDLVHYIPRLLSREADILRTVANGAMIERNTGNNPHTVKKVVGEGGVLQSRREGTVEPIATPDVPAFHETHSDRAMDLFKMLGFAPDAAWGLPGSGSGTDRGMQLQPLLEYTAMKQLNWQAGLARMFSYGYRMIESHLKATKTYRGDRPGKGGKRIPFVLQLGPDLEAATQESTDADGMPFEITYPRTPKELFDGDYSVRFVWRSRVDPDDPQYVMSEVNKFTQGLQSMQTTLENLGFQAPEEEMRRIEKEAERFPWVNQGLVSLLMAQLRGNAQGTGGGAPADMGGAVSGAMDTMLASGGGAGGGALNADAATSALGPSAVGTPYGGA